MDDDDGSGQGRVRVCVCSGPADDDDVRGDRDIKYRYRKGALRPFLFFGIIVPIIYTLINITHRYEVRASRAAFPLPVLVERRTNGGIRQATLFNWQILLSSTSSMYFTHPAPFISNYKYKTF
jgi:hypothetical protein